MRERERERERERRERRERERERELKVLNNMPLQQANFWTQMFYIHRRSCPKDVTYTISGFGTAVREKYTF